MGYNVLTGLIALLGLGSFVGCSTYDRIDNVPNLGWDFIIVGGAGSSGLLCSQQH